MRGFVITLAAALAAGPALAEAPLWNVDQAASRLEFIGRQNDAEVRGGFDDFVIDVRFAPDDLDGASLRVEVDMTSFVVEGAERREILKGSAWFDVEDFQNAVFEARDFVATEDGYRAIGTLTIKGFARQVPLVFDVAIDGERAVAEGRAEILRTDFGVGPEGAVFGVRVAPEVDVVFHVQATRAE